MIAIAIGTTIIVILVSDLAILSELDSMIGWLMLDMGFTLLLIGLKGENE